MNYVRLSGFAAFVLTDIEKKVGSLYPPKTIHQEIMFLTILDETYNVLQMNTEILIYSVAMAAA